MFANVHVRPRIHMAQVVLEQPAVSRPTLERRSFVAEVASKNESYSSGISWAAVIGGAFVSASLALILLSLGTGLGLSSVSPWSNVGASATTIGKAAIGWLILTQILASAMGGYLAGRLRTKWTNVHSDEVYFRDTAHGFLVWAVGLILTAAFLASAAASLAGGAVQTRPNGPTGAAAESGTLIPNLYFVDTLLRSNNSTQDRNDLSVRGDVERIFSHALAQGAMPSKDKTYLGQLVSTRTGLTQADAENRVSDVFEEAQQSADRTRKALAHLSLWIFIALLSGAFCASFAGTIGGRQRDYVRT
jgi:hypothetical protein